MNKLETKYAIGDLIYIAKVDEVDKDVIKAIKIVGVQGRVSYGIKISGAGSGLFGTLYGSNDGFRWFRSSELFGTLKDAEKRSEELQKREKEKDSAKVQKEILDMEDKLKRDKQNLQRKKKGLPLIEDDEDWD